VSDNLSMAWQVHEGGQMREELVPESSLPASFLAGQLSMCESCQRSSAAFLTQCIEATKRAGKMPEDQLWLAVFNALKEMLAVREACRPCQTRRTTGQMPAHDPMVTRLGAWNRAKRAIGGK
jgi:hypothetical protein